MQDTYGIDLSDDLSVDSDSNKPVLSASPNTIAYDDDLYNTVYENKSDLKSYSEVNSDAERE
jgi:hypothetical protein